MKKQKGFTLIELMVVMAIIAVLATAGISAYTDYIKKARDTTRLSIASQVETAVNALMGSNGGVPPTAADLITYLGTLNMTAAMDAVSGEESHLLSSVGSMVRDFVGGSPLYALIREPSGGRAVCLGYDAGGEVVGGKSCAFRYIVYSDNTYVIGYGIEHESNMKMNFYNVAIVADGASSQYMQVKGSAQYVGMPSILETGGPGPTAVFIASKVTVDETTGEVTPDVSSAIVVGNGGALSADDSGGGGGGDGALNGEACTNSDDCASGLTCTWFNICTDGAIGSTCGQTQDCDGSSYCADSVCTAGTGQIGDSCSEVGRCTSGLWCAYDRSNWTQTCSSNPLFGKCRNDAECGNGLICTYYNGCSDKELHSPCATNADCNSEYCYAASAGDRGGFSAYTCTDGSAGAGCYDDTNCQSGLTCVPDGLGEGGSCTAGGGGCQNPGDDCGDGSAYVTSTLRTTASDAGSFPWVDCSFCGGNNGFSACYGDSGWVCPPDAEIPLAYHPAAQACANLGEGWHLPSRSELDQLFQVSNCKSANGNCDDTGAVVGGFYPTRYSTSEEDSNIEYFWLQDFGNGQQNPINNKWYGGDVRCVRSVN